jgi:2-dehydro-3-deoxygluconokinase
MPEVLTIGETMAVLTPSRPGRLASTRTLHLGVGGAESNVAISLVHLGVTAGWISALGRDELGDLVLNSVRGEGVDCSRVTRSAAPTGLYLRDEAGNGQVRAFYYRGGSAASAMGPNQLDEDYVRSSRFLHLTGITLALSRSCEELVHAAARMARRCGVSVSLDVNYRGKLWTAQQARAAIDALLPHVDILFAGEDEAALLWPEAGDAWLERMAAAGPAEVVLKRGAEGAVGWHAGHGFDAPGLPVTVRDTVGAGDAFAAGYLAASCWKLPVPQRLRYGNAMGAFTVSTWGDCENAPRREELEAFMEQRASIGR